MSAPDWCGWCGCPADRPCSCHRRCTQHTTTCRYRTVAPPTVGGFPQDCAGPITHRLVWTKGTHHYCEAHGEAHVAASPFGGYERVLG